MKKTTTTVLTLGAIVFLFFAFQKATCYKCYGSGTKQTTLQETCTSCKGKTTLRCKDSKVLRKRRFINNNLDENYYDCKVGRYRVRESVDYFDYSGTICENCHGTGKIECGRCKGYGKTSKTSSSKDGYCKGTGKIFAYQKWLK